MDNFNTLITQILGEEIVNIQNKQINEIISNNKNCEENKNWCEKLGRDSMDGWTQTSQTDILSVEGTASLTRLREGRRKSWGNAFQAFHLATTEGPSCTLLIKFSLMEPRNVAGVPGV